MQYKKRSLHHLYRTIILGSVLAVATAGARAEDFSMSYAELGYTNNTDRMYSNDASNNSMSMIRLGHYGTWAYGDNFFFADQYKSADPLYNSFNSRSDKAIFLGWIPRLSINKLSGLDMSNGFVKNVYLAYRMERYPGSGFPAAIDNVGVSFDLAVPGTVFFEQDFYTRTSKDYSGSKFLSRTVWMAPFTLGSVKMHFDGLLLINTWNSKADPKTKTLVQFQPELMADLTADGKLQAGLRVIYDRGEQLIDADFGHYITKSHTTSMALMRWTF